MSTDSGPTADEAGGSGSDNSRPAGDLDGLGLRPRFDLHLGVTTRSDQPGRCVAALRLRPEHRNIEGWIHGGVFLTVLDTAMGHAVGSLRSRGVRGAATMQLSCQFVQPPQGERLEAEGRVVRLGRTSAFVEGVLRDEGDREIARAQGVWRVWREGEPRERS